MNRRITTAHHNIPWLTSLPIHWGIVRSKALFAQRKELALASDQQLSATQAFGVIPQREYEERIGRKLTQITRHLEKRRHVECDDFVISMRSFQGGLERAWASGCIRSSYVVLQPSEEVDIGYFSYLFKSHDYIQALRATANFIRDGQDLSFRNFCLVDLPRVPIDEQKSISSFLDHADRKIRRYVRAKRQLIALLNEQKQAIIHRAVTRGLDPNVKLKPSGIEWLGDVPEHWTLKRFKFATQITSGQVDPRQDGYRNQTLIAPNHIESGSGRIINEETAEQQGADSGKYQVRAGQVIYSKIRPNLKKATIALKDCLCSADMYPITARRTDLTAEFLLLLLLSGPFTKYAVDYSMRVAMPKINRDALGECWLWFPEIDEQNRIVAQLNEDHRPYSLAIQRVKDEVALIQEYRTRLIADVVTGKLDVRDAAAELPEELDEVEPDSEELFNENEITDDVELDAEPEEVEA